MQLYPSGSFGYANKRVALPIPFVPPQCTPLKNPPVATGCCWEYPKVLAVYWFRAAENYFSRIPQITSANMVYSKAVSIFLVLFFLIIGFVVMVLRKEKRNIRENELLHAQIEEKNKSLQAIFLNLDTINKQNKRLMKLLSKDLTSCVTIIQHGVIFLLTQNREHKMYDTLQLIQDACEESLSMIAGISPEYLRKEEPKKKIDLKPFLEQCVQLLSEQAALKKQKVQLTAKTAFAMVDCQQLRRVINNIIDNAIKFSEENATIDITLEKKGRKSLISIKDHGRGIAPEIKERIFKEERITGAPGTAGEKTFGFGLAIVKRITESNNGKIWFDSKVNEGTAFYIELNP